MTIFHSSCPKVSKHEPAPKFEWGGFFMIDIADYICPACGDILYVEEGLNLDESDT